MIVRATLVTGMPRHSVISAGVSVGLRWSGTPFGALRPPRPGTVTWITPPARRRSRAAAAVVWLSAAHFPASEDRGHPVAVERQHPVPDRVDAAVNGLKSLRLAAPLNLARRQPRL